MKAVQLNTENLAKRIFLLTDGEVSNNEKIIAYVQS